MYIPRLLALLLLISVCVAPVAAQSSPDKSPVPQSLPTHGAPQVQGESSHLASVRTYTPGEFQQSLLDRLSGGLTQKFPYRMAADSQGRFLVTDPMLSVVHVFDTRQGKRWQMKGDRRHPLDGPAYIAVDADDNIYVTDVQRPAVLVFEPNGRLKQTIGAGVLNVPTGICVDKPKRKLYVADWWKGVILSFDLEGKLLGIFGTPGSGPGQLRGPRDIVIHHDTLVVLDSINSRFELFDLQGNFHGVWPFGPNRVPIAFAFDGTENLLYVDSYSGALVAMDPQGRVLGRLGQLRSYGQWTAQPFRASFTCVTVNALGDILVLRPTLKLEVVKLVTDTGG
jgi:DNA-binding beta-propeller fold protein YncE